MATEKISTEKKNYKLFFFYSVEIYGQSASYNQTVYIPSDRKKTTTSHGGHAKFLKVVNQLVTIFKKTWKRVWQLIYFQGPVSIYFHR